LNTPADVPAALSAFLRGVERRGIVLAELQCGRRETGEIAMAAALRAFGQYASEQPMAEWPRGFWSLLASAPPLRQAHPEARWPQEMDWLADLSDSDRLALLLRLAAGLDEDDAAAVMGVNQVGYRGALTRACPRDEAGQPDAAAWRALAEAIQQHLRALSPERLAHLSRLREALAPDVPEPTPAPVSVAPEPVRKPSPSPAPRRPRSAAARRPFPWRQVLIAAAVLLVLAAIAGGWWYLHQGRLAAPATVGAQGGGDGAQPLRDEAQVQVEPLSRDDEADKRFSQAEAVLTHPDFDALMDPQGLALAQRAGFLAWYAAAPQDRQREAAEAMNAPAEARDAAQ
jgi:hypothetical protein